MSAAALLDRVDSLRRTGPDKWVARCPAHDDRGPSLAIRELDDGRVLVHCFAGCSAQEIVTAAGLALVDLFPPRALASHSAKPDRRPFPALDVLRCIAQEALLVAVAAMRVGRGHLLSSDDRKRLLVASARIGSALELLEGS